MNPANATKQSVINQINLHQQNIKGYGVKRLGMFGSFVRNQNTANSDVDFLVEFEDGKKNYKNFLGLAYYLEELLERKVDLLTTQSLNKYLAPYILKETEYVIWK